jgi:F0F1-type ATP synthase assembly protein I
MANGLFDEDNEIPPREEPVKLVDYRPDSADETNRKSSLAWSAGIVFFSSIAFMLFIGWLADWLLGSSPWGIVGGIVIGSIIGFIQFFRLSSQIFNTDQTQADMNPLLNAKDDDSSIPKHR